MSPKDNAISHATPKCPLTYHQTLEMFLSSGCKTDFILYTPLWYGLRLGLFVYVYIFFFSWIQGLKHKFFFWNVFWFCIAFICSKNSEYRRKFWRACRGGLNGNKVPAKWESNWGHRQNAEALTLQTDSTENSNGFSCELWDIFMVLLANEEVRVKYWF